MDDLTSLSALKAAVDKQYQHCHGYRGSKKDIYQEAILAVKSILHHAKIIDAVPVVRCKDCIHNGSFDTDCPIRWDKRDDDFCSFGERKDDE